MQLVSRHSLQQDATVVREPVVHIQVEDLLVVGELGKLGIDLVDLRQNLEIVISREDRRQNDLGARREDHFDRDLSAQ